MRLRDRALLLGALAVIALSFGMISPANALWEGGSCGNGNQLATNPTTARPVRVSVQPQLFWNPNQLMWMWVCVDDGGTTGAHSVGTAGYYWANTTGASYGQHVVNCIGAGCDDMLFGATVSGVAAGPGGGGARTCVFLDVRSDCEEIRVGISPTPGPGTVNTSTDNPRGGGFCGVSVGTTCTGRELVVTTGGTNVGVTATGTVPASHGAPVPLVSACINRYGLTTNPVAVNPGSSSC